MQHFQVAGINFDHMHMGALLQQAHEHPAVEIVAICDESPERMEDVARHLRIPNQRRFTDYRRCLEVQRPYLGPVEGHYTDWTPLDGRPGLFPEDLDTKDPWQFRNILFR